MKSTPPRFQSDRRAVLRGFGTLLALPWLESVAPAMSFGGGGSRSGNDGGGGNGDGDGDDAAPMKRMVVLYSPNGMHMPDWKPKDAGTEFDLPYLLQPFDPFRKSMTVISGLAQNCARPGADGPGDHARAAAVFLTGVRATKTGGQINLGPSVDQLAAAQLGGATRFRSLQLGCERGGNSGQCDSGYSCAYSNNISWQNETTPTGKETNPRQLFDRLFRGDNAAEASAAAAQRRKKRRSILDYVRGEAKQLEGRVSAADRIKLDEFQSGIREMERRLDFVEKDHVAEISDSLRPENTPSDFGSYIRLMMDLLVLALQTDRSRIATFMIANEGSNRAYTQIGIRDGHHELSHHRNDPGRQKSIRTINRFHTEQVAYFLKRLSETRDGATSLLDQIMMVYGSGIGDGNRHNHDNLPVLLFGGGGGTLQGGRHLRLATETPFNNLLVTLLNRFGANVPQFGDSTGMLEGI